MRRINPFEAGARDNFPELSPLKPPQVTKDISYGPSDDESRSGSSYDDDDYDRNDLDVYEDDFDDDLDGDVVIDAGGSDIDDEIPVNKAGGDGKVKKNIDLDWSIDTLAKVKPAEISINDEYSSDEDLVSPTKLKFQRDQEDELQRKSTEYFEKGKFTTTPLSKEVHTMSIQQKLYPPKEDKDESSDDELDDLNMRTPIKYGRERTYDDEIEDVNMSISNLQKKFQDLLEDADSSSDTGLAEQPAGSMGAKNVSSDLEELEELDYEVDKDLDRDYHTEPKAKPPANVADRRSPDLDDDVQFGSDLELDSDLDLDDQDLDVHHLASVSGKPITSTPMKPPMPSSRENEEHEKEKHKTVASELKAEKLVGLKNEGPDLLDAGSDLSELDESLSDVSDLDQDFRDEQRMHIQSHPTPATRVTSSFLTQLDEDDDSDLDIEDDLDVIADNRYSPTSSLKSKDVPDVRSDSESDDFDMDKGNLMPPNSATPISASSPIFSSSPIPLSQPLDRKPTTVPLQSTPSVLEKEKVLEEPKMPSRFSLLNQLTPIKSVTTPSSPTTLSTPTSLGTPILSTPTALATPTSSNPSSTASTPTSAPINSILVPTSPLAKLQNTPSYGQKSPVDSPLSLVDVKGGSAKNSNTTPKTDPFATAGLPPLRQAASGKPEVRKQLDMDSALDAAGGRKLERHELDAPSKPGNLQESKSGPKSNPVKPPVHVTPIEKSNEPKDSDQTGKKDLPNLLGRPPLKKTDFSYDEVDIQNIQELGGDFVDHETGEVFEQNQTIGTPWKQKLKMQEQDIGVSPIKGFMHNKDYFGPVAAAHEEDEEELMPNILDESGNETTIIDEGGDEQLSEMVDAGEVDARKERARLATYNGLKSSIASNHDVLNPPTAKSGDDKDDISSIIAKYINLKHPPEEIHNKENNFNAMSDGASLLSEASENSAAGVRRRLAERDRDLSDLLKDDDVIADSTLSTNTRTRYSSPHLYTSAVRSHSAYSRYSPIARPVSPERYQYEPTRYSNSQGPVYMPPYTPPPYPTYTPPAPYSPTFRHTPTYVPSYTSYTPSYTPSHSSLSYTPSYIPSYAPSYTPSYSHVRTTSAYSPSPSPLPSNIPYSPARHIPSSSPLSSSLPPRRLSSFAPLPPSSSLSSSLYYPSSISYTASKYANPTKHGL